MKNEEIFLATIIRNWQFQIKYFNATLEKLSDEQLLNEVSPNRNRGIYLLGHLTAYHDLTLPLLGFEGALYPELATIFIHSPDKATDNLPSVQSLKQQWNTVNEKLLQHFNSLSVDDWLTRHSNISEEDFVKEPHRNRLNVLISRITHLAYHNGQLNLLVKK